MAANEGIQPVDPNAQVPADPNVRIPDHVRRAAEAAEAFYKPPPDQAVPQAEADAAAAEAARAEVARVNAENGVAAPAAPAAPAHAGDSFTGTADAKSMQDSEWARRYNSMQGRWQASERAKAAMEQQMVELGQELVRTQNMLSQTQGTQPTQQTRQAPTNHNNLITEEDRANYGDELIDLARRAAQSAVSPELERLRADNAQLTQRVQNTGKRELFATLDQNLPSWRQINQDNRFKAWLRLPNIYTGDLRGNMLKAAVDGAHAPKVLALFKDFLAEATATGLMAPEAPAEQHLAPHAPALDLETLAAPGRARPASGDSQLPADKKIYSRADISKFFDEKRRGLWANRLAEAQAVENDLTAAQREGRIR